MPKAQTQLEPWESETSIPILDVGGGEYATPEKTDGVAQGLENRRLANHVYYSKTP